MKTNNWFEVDKQGLSKILRRRGLEFIAYELISNAWDSKATKVDITIESIPNRPLVYLSVEDDDPEGFTNISHAFTMFADSNRRDNPNQRGRFNLGEKLVLAIAEEANLSTTKGSIHFDTNGRTFVNGKRDKGSRIDIWFKANRKEADDIISKINIILPPIPTYLNGKQITQSKPLSTFNVSLPTVLPNEEGYLKNVQRKTQVEVYDSLETPYLYELGIPVVETDDKYSYNIMQKVPVSLDRDNVPPSYLRTLRVFALNELHKNITPEDSNHTWVRDALSDERITPEAVKTVITKRFGEKVVIFDPSDQEANSLAFSKGYTVVKGNQLSHNEWSNIKRDNVMKPAGQVTPSPKPYSEDGREINIVPEEKYTVGMIRTVKYAKDLYKALLDKDVAVRIVHEFGWPFLATYGSSGTLTLNKCKLSTKWFDEINEDMIALLIHEAAHEYSGDHLSSRYHEALCKLGAKMHNLKYLEN